MKGGEGGGVLLSGRGTCQGNSSEGEGVVTHRILWPRTGICACAGETDHSALLPHVLASDPFPNSPFCAADDAAPRMSSDSDRAARWGPRLL